MVDLVKMFVFMISKKWLFQQLGDQVEQVFGFDVLIVVEVLLECENFGLIGVGYGIVLFYVWIEVVDCVCGLFVCFEKLLDFDLVDCQFVDLVFVLLVFESVGVEYFKVLVLVLCIMCDQLICGKLCVNMDVVMFYIILIEVQVI